MGLITLTGFTVSYYSGSYCCIANHPRIYGLKQQQSLSLIISGGEEFGSGSARWFGSRHFVRLQSDDGWAWGHPEGSLTHMSGPQAVKTRGLDR